MVNYDSYVQFSRIVVDRFTVFDDFHFSLGILPCLLNVRTLDYNCPVNVF